jgi:hypothetical protein
MTVPVWSSKAKNTQPHPHPPNMWRAWHITQSQEVNVTLTHFSRMITPVSTDPGKNLRSQSPVKEQTPGSFLSLLTLPSGGYTFTLLCIKKPVPAFICSESLFLWDQEFSSPWTWWPTSGDIFWQAKPGDSRRSLVRSRWLFFCDSGKPTWQSLQGGGGLSI